MADYEPGEVPGDLHSVPEPGMMDADADQGWSDYVEGRYDQAEANFRRALAKRPDSVEANYGLALLLKSKGNNEESRQHFQKVIEQVEAGALQGNRARASMLRHLSKAHLQKISPNDWHAPAE